MPIYEYRCGVCGHELEVMQKIADAALTDCPECGEVALKKLISPVGFRFKGGGWYETDFKTNNKRNLADSGNSAESDSKPADSKKKTDSAKGDDASKSSTSSKSESSNSSASTSGKTAAA